MTVVAISIQRSSIIVGAKTSKEKGGWFDQWVGTILKVKQLISACLASRSMLSVHLGFCHLIILLVLVVHFSPFPKRMLLRKYRSYSNSFPHLYPLLPSLFLFFSSPRRETLGRDFVSSRELPGSVGVPIYGVMGFLRERDFSRD